MSNWHAGLIAVAFSCTVLMAGCASNPVTGKHDLVFMSEQQELALGRKSHPEVLKQFKVYDHPVLQKKVADLGDELARKSHRPNLVFHFTLLDSPDVNAFAIPGGYIYITRGILSYMHDESQLAGVLGHEIGHVTARHSVRQQTQQTLTGLIGAAATIATGQREVAELTNTLGTAYVRGYGRAHELEADRLGAEYLARVGFDPESMLGVIGILKDQEEVEIARAKAEKRQPRLYHGIFSSHPKNDARLQEVVAAAQRFKAGDRPVRGDDFLHAMDGMVYGHNEDQGVLRGNHFFHTGLDLFIEFPAGWQVKNSPDRLVATSAARDQFIQIIHQDLNPRQSAEQLLRGHFQRLSRGEYIDDARLPAYSGIVRLDTPFGKRDARVGAVIKDQASYLISGVSKQGLIGAPYFDTVASIRTLGSDERRLAKPHRIRVVRARPGDTFDRLASQSPLSHYPEQQLRVLNGMYPQGEPVAGQWIKVIK